MPIPTTIRTSVSPDTLAKVTRLFNGTLSDMLAEVFQNARRAGASRVDITIVRASDGRLWLTVADDGRGVENPAALLALGCSGWSDETLRTEDPAGMGLFALAGRPVRLATRSAVGAWSLEIPVDAWASGTELDVEAGRGPDERGTSVSVQVPESWAAELRTEAEHAARYFPLPVTLDGAEVLRRDFLAEAGRIEEWRGLRLGVVAERGWSREPRINFHGVTVPCPLPQVAELRGPGWSVRVDVVDCPELQLVLPARKEVLATPFLDSLREACERAIYRHIATREHHRLPHTSWHRAAALGVALPEASAQLDPWSPVTNDGDPDLRFRPHRDGEVPPLPAEPLVVDDFGPDLEQSLARAIHIGAPELENRLVEPCRDYEGYAWYDALPRVTEVVGALVRGEVCWTTRDEAAPPTSGAVDRVLITLTIIAGETTIFRTIETDLLLVTNEDACTGDPDEQGVFVVPGPRLGPGDVGDAAVAAFFMASDDRDADSWETQHEGYERAALDLARRLLLGDEAADLARLRDAVRDRIAWLVPKGRELRVRYDAISLEVSLTPLSASPVTEAG